MNVDGLILSQMVNLYFIILINIEEIYERSYDDYKKLEQKYKDLNIKFAYDGMKINV